MAVTELEQGEFRLGQAVVALLPDGERHPGVVKCIVDVERQKLYAVRMDASQAWIKFHPSWLEPLHARV
jgi:hypothetical protein